MHNRPESGWTVTDLKTCHAYTCEALSAHHAIALVAVQLDLWDYAPPYPPDTGLHDEFGDDLLRRFVPKHTPYYTAHLCQVGRLYGGSEEGGWWYDQRIPVSADEDLHLFLMQRSFASHAEANGYRYRVLRPLADELNKDRPPLGSVLSDFVYASRVCIGEPLRTPQTAPQYC